MLQNVVPFILDTYVILNMVFSNLLNIPGLLQDTRVRAPKPGTALSLFDDDLFGPVSVPVAAKPNAGGTSAG
jgi:hypothetical protein